jgi:nickel-dependent lactate racemase
VPARADILVAAAYPSDIDYWQVISKPLTNAISGVKFGGTVILLAPCPDGISPVHGETLKNGAKLSYAKVLQSIENKEVSDLIGAAQLLTYIQQLENVNVICYSDGLREKDKEALGVKHASTPDEALEMAFDIQGREAKVGVVKCGEVLPVVKAN